MFKRMMIPMIAAMVAVTLAFGTNDSGPKKTDNKKLIENYYLKAGMSAQQALTATNYQSTLPSGITCGGTPEVPCHYEFIPTQDYPTFQDLLDSKNTSSVVADANEKREQ
jgi:hypothetical protein